MCIQSDGQNKRQSSPFQRARPFSVNKSFCRCDEDCDDVDGDDDDDEDLAGEARRASGKWSSRMFSRWGSDQVRQLASSALWNTVRWAPELLLPPVVMSYTVCVSNGIKQIGMEWSSNLMYGTDKDQSMRTLAMTASDIP